jgi:hypothetical protein
MWLEKPVKKPRSEFECSHKITDEPAWTASWIEKQD